MDPSLQQAILNKYNLTTLWPTRWPDEKNDALLGAGRQIAVLAPDSRRGNIQGWQGEPGAEGRAGPAGHVPECCPGAADTQRASRGGHQAAYVHVEDVTSTPSNAHRQPLPPQLDDLLAAALPLAGPQRCLDRHVARRPRVPLQFDREEVRLAEGAGRIQLRALRRRQSHHRPRLHRNARAGQGARATWARAAYAGSQRLELLGQEV
jgi:hypothetical protein